jgi:hypothetical protein
MEELYVEGLATHDDPEPCGCFRKGAVEALAGARVGRAIEPRNREFQGVDTVDHVEDNTVGSVRREFPGGPARSENHGMHGISRHENREIPCPPVGVMADGTPRERPGGNLGCTGTGGRTRP